MSIATDREELARVKLAISELLDTGQSYSLVGGHSVTNPRLIELREHEASIRARILRRRGYAGRIG